MGSICSPIGRQNAINVLNSTAQADFVLLCEHASCEIPIGWDNLGLIDGIVRTHIGWDIGAADLTRALSRRLDTTAFLAGYSRLFIDCNRDPDSDDSILFRSDDCQVPGNRYVTKEERSLRADLAFHPFHNAVNEHLEQMVKRRKDPVLISIHSFTPEMNGVRRPWQVGVLFGRCPRLGRPLLDQLRSHHMTSIHMGGLHVAENEPYSMHEHEAYSLLIHGIGRDLPHVAIEVRNDLLRSDKNVEKMAKLLAECIVSAAAALKCENAQASVAHKQTACTTD